MLSRASKTLCSCLLSKFKRRLVLLCICIGCMLVLGLLWQLHLSSRFIVRNSLSTYRLYDRYYRPKERLLEESRALSSRTNSIWSQLNFPDEDKLLKITPPLLERSVLVFSDYAKSSFVSQLKEIFESMRISYDVVTWNNPSNNAVLFPHVEADGGRARYGLIVFTSHQIMEQLDNWTKSVLDEFCHKFGIGVIIFTEHIVTGNHQAKFSRLASIPLWIFNTDAGLYDLRLASESPIFSITKPGGKVSGAIAGKSHYLLWSSHPGYEPIVYVHHPEFGENEMVNVIYDNGEYDGIRRVVFGVQVTQFWLYQLIFLDAVNFLSLGYLGYNLDRYLQVDIDDVFVAPKGQKLTRADVKALVQAQDDMAKLIPNFHFYLGFTAKHCKNSSLDAENDGDEYLLQFKDKFRWFCHSYEHTKPHDMTYDWLVNDMIQNRKFALEHGLPVESDYSVSPHHSGTYPVHSPLYEAWKEVWDIKVTSTEGYPHLYPARRRRGFLFRNISVLPRQTCGLFTKTLTLHEYPKGPDWLQNSVEGGEMFWTVVYNPINIFMTHFGNYGHDRLAIDLFKNVTVFIQTWTNLNLISARPRQLAQRYFELFPREIFPIWSDPCSDKRHRKIWSGTEKYCQPTGRHDEYRLSRVPDMMIIGPQKTGTTALHTFLALHPNMKSSVSSRNNFEEIQFFNRNAYLNGVEWYMGFFPDGPREKGVLFFEKSANYFDSLKAPARAAALLPRVVLVVISIDPVHRAYSWYQHLRSKGDPLALNHTFLEVLLGQNKTDDHRFAVMQERVLSPGLYAAAMDRWLQYYNPSKIYVVDGEELRNQPASAVSKLVAFLGLPPYDFQQTIRFNAKKGFYCPFTEGQFHCLGRSKGRQYADMDSDAFALLKEFYRLPNLRFAEQLEKLNKPLPAWLQRVVDYT